MVTANDCGLYIEANEYSGEGLAIDHTGKAALQAGKKNPDKVDGSIKVA